MSTIDTKTGNEPRIERIRKRMQLALAPLELVLGDDSAMHVGHAGAAS
ncbi:MAG: BolA protein, partial [Janthinobacterium sp.]